MSASHDLHRLIHSLSPSEKRYFRLHAQTHSGKANSYYLQIFDIIQGQEVYNQDKVLEKLSKNRKVTRFSAEKKYLYLLILKSMRAYTAERDVFRKIRGMIQDVEFLFDKTLYPESYKILEKASKLAVEYDDLPSQVELLAWERRLLKRYPQKNKLGKLEALIRWKESLMRRLETENAYSDLYDRFFLLSQRETQLRHPEELERVKKLWKDSGLAKVEMADSFKSKHLYFQIITFYYRMQGLESQACDQYGHLVAHWDAHPQQVAEDPGKYKTLLSNYLAFCQLVDRFEEFPVIMEKIKGLPTRNKREEIQKQYDLFNCELLYFLNSGDLPKGIEVTQKLELWLVKHENEAPRSKLLGLNYNSSLLHFLSGEFRGALKWVNRVLNFPEVEERRDIIQVSRILQLIIHFELENFEIIENLIRSARRYYRKSDRFYEFEGLFLRTMRKLVRQFPEAHANSLQEFLKELQPIREKIPDWPGLNETLIWVESKLTNQPISKALKPKNSESAQEVTS